ncbi:AraC family transcriptional regulator [Aquimarina sp. AD1]|uniref:helix-turn-helix transcriptional regulator n=1 Tax=Aquimarina sp. (strain AD1) TaxID=1714848 RepID=UPI000E508B34|nr:AraC family transcriptional regulator [Aquimarina sp. AD1]AXT57172.1 AraC family transcriptional regulator [Aquimarina sp. AD1]RKN35840.1 helix-turn-helix domain-containing protein [Aquimarina sp. AD1]
MENVKDNGINIPSELGVLNTYLPGNIEVNYDIHILTIDSSFGKGQVRHTSLQNGLESYDFDIKLYQTVKIPINYIATDALQFFYCLEGYCNHQFEDFEEKVKIDQFQTAVAHSNPQLSNSIIIEKNISFMFNIICINKKEYFDKFSAENNRFDKKIQDLLSDIKNKSKHFHLGNYNLKIAEQLKLLFGIEHSNEISELLSQKGRYYLILAKHIEQFHTEIENNSNTSGLLKNELISISELGEYIKEHPEIQHSIRTLCLQSGLSPAKLQEGFKFIFDRTVSDFVRNIRLEKAEKLIRTTDLSISEIVYSIGLTSRSYFCKIFKRKYFCSPKEYKIRKSC